MVGDYDINELVKKIHAQRINDFLNPDYELFKEIYKSDLPKVMTELYSLQTALMTSEIQLETPSGGLWIQEISSLNKTTISSGINIYNYLYLPFARGGENQAYLCYIPKPEFVWIDDESNGELLEEFSMKLGDILEAIRHVSNT